MTDHEWLTSTDAKALREQLRGKVTDRKLRLFMVACCRHVWHRLCDESRAAVEVLERFADGRATLEELKAAKAAANEARTRYFLISRATYNGARAAAWATAEVNGTTTPFVLTLAVLLSTAEAATDETDTSRALTLAGEAHCSLLRCVFGNPLRPVVPDPGWLTSTVVALARRIYEQRAFENLPMLADALEDAGCDNADVLEHCRNRSVAHARGCWVIDLLLGNE
jgi:hypothetical protein